MNLEEEGDKLLARWKSWPYKNTLFLILSLILFWYFADSHVISGVIRRLGELGYIGALIGGALFVSSFTIAPAAVIIFDVAKVLNPLLVAIFAGMGAVVGDYIIFRFLKDRVFEELSPVFGKIGGSWLKKIFLTPYFIWVLPFAGAFIVASPLPDEVGITLLGLSKVKSWQFILITFLLNAIGIFLTILLAGSI